MREEEIIRDENGNEVLLDDPDYPWQEAMAREQAGWERKWFRPTADPTDSRCNRPSAR